MSAKSQPRFSPSLLRNSQYSGTISTLFYNWPIFVGALFCGLIALVAGTVMYTPWNWVLLSGGIFVLVLAINILVASFIV